MGKHQIRRSIKAVPLLLLAIALTVSYNLSQVNASPSNKIETIALGTNGNAPYAGTIESQTNSSGRYIVFRSNATNLVSSPTVDGQLPHIFIKDRLLNTVKLVDQSANGLAGDGYSLSPAISGNGRYVVYLSSASNIVSNVNGSTLRILRYDVQLNTTVLVDVNSSVPVINNNGLNDEPSISYDGHYVAFVSSATNLDPAFPNLNTTTNGTNGQKYIYLKNMSTGAVKLISKGVAGANANGASSRPVIDCSGSKLAFMSSATNLNNDTTNSNGSGDIFVNDLIDNTMTNVTKAGSLGAFSLYMSCSGQYLGFSSGSGNLDSTNTVATSGTRKLYKYDIGNNTMKMVIPKVGQSMTNNDNDGGSITDDGKYITYASSRSDLVANDTNNKADIFVTNTENGVTTMMTLSATGAQANQPTYTSAITPDGRYVLITSAASNLVTLTADSGKTVPYNHGLGYIIQASLPYDY